MDWPFTTTQLWGENPRGRWIIHIGLNSENFRNNIAALLSVRIIIHGTKNPPYTKEVLPVNVSDELALVRRAEGEIQARKRRS